MDILSLIPSFGGLVWTVIALIVTISIIVAVHEYGHYIIGRLCGIHAEVFSLGFGPVLFSRRDRHGTKWQVAALPLGGFVKFLGDANAASGKDAHGLSLLTEAERRHTMHGAPLWARSATVMAGPAFNFMLSILIFAGFFMVQGVATDQPTVGRVNAMPDAEASLVPGDQILSIAGTPTPDFEAFSKATESLAPEGRVEYRVLRAGEELTIQGPQPFPPIVDGVQPMSAAMDAGILANDVILSVDGVAVNTFPQLREIVGASEGKPLLLKVWRDGETLDITLLPRRKDIPKSEGGFETRWLIGLNGGLAFYPETRTPGPIEAVRLGASQTWDVITTSLSGIAHILTGAISTCNLSGPLSIAETSGAAASLGVSSFIWFIAMLSTAIGLFNLFPVPVLDGGHLVFHIWEAVAGRPPSMRALNVLMGAGFAALMGLMLFALSNDIFCP